MRLVFADPDEMHAFYRLSDDRAAIPCTPEEWSAEVQPRMPIHVNWTNLENGFVSTIFIGLNMRPLSAEPALFETITCLLGKWDLARLSSTWAEAELVHQDAVRVLRAKLYLDRPV